MAALITPSSTSPALSLPIPDVVVAGLAPRRTVLMVHESPAALGGSERVLVDEARVLRRRGHRVLLLTGPLTDPELAGLCREFDDVVVVPDVFSMNRSVTGRVRAVRELRRRVARAGAVDLVHIHLLTPAWAIAALSRCWPTIVYAHIPQCPNQMRRRHGVGLPCDRRAGVRCLTDGFLREGCGRPPGEPAWSRLGIASALQKNAATRRAFRRSAAVLAPSRWQWERLHADSALPAVSFVLNPPVTPPADGHARGSARRRVLFVGRIADAKGPTDAVRLLSRLPEDVELRLVGEGPAEDRVRELAAELGVLDRVVFVGRVGRAQLADEVADARALVLPYTMPETFNLAGAEAAAVNLPVVGYDVGGMTDWAQHREHVHLVPVGDAAALGTVLAKVLDEPLPPSLVAPDTTAPHVDELLRIYELVLANAGQNTSLGRAKWARKSGASTVQLSSPV